MSSTSGQRIITMKQAERILEYDMPGRDFWYVTDDDDNHDLLQEVLDIIFNCIEGQNYEARYSHSASFSRLVIYCCVCKKDLASYDPFISHDSGKAHKRALSMINVLKEKEEVSNEMVIFLNPSDPLELFAAGSFEDRIDHTDKPVAGLQFIYKERLAVDDSLHFTCDLCKRNAECFRISDDEMYYHVTSPSHITRFMEKVYGIRERDYADLVPLVKKHMRRNGRLMHKILEIEWKAYPNELRKRELSIKRSLSPDSQQPEIKRERGSPSRVVATREFGCQANIQSTDIKEFVSELKACSLLEEEIVSLAEEEVTTSDRQSLTTAVKVFGNALDGYYEDKGDDDELCSLVSKFNRWTSTL